MLKAYLT